MFFFVLTSDIQHKRCNATSIRCWMWCLQVSFSATHCMTSWCQCIEVAWCAGATRVDWQWEEVCLCNGGVAGHLPGSAGDQRQLVRVTLSSLSLLSSLCLQCCWLGGRKGIRPVKTEWWGNGVVICLERGADDLHMVHLMPLPPHHLLLQWNPELFTFLVPAYPGCPGKKAVKCI